MIIVTGMANAGRGVVDGDSSGDEDNNEEEKKFMMEARMRCNPRTPRLVKLLRRYFIVLSRSV